MSDYEDHSSSSPGEGDLLIALCSFNGEGPDQLSMVSRDVVRVIESNEDGWYKVRRLTDDRVGLAPRKILVSGIRLASGNISRYNRRPTPRSLNCTVVMMRLQYATLCWFDSHLNLRFRSLALLDMQPPRLPFQHLR